MTHQYMEIKLKELEKRIKALEQELILDKIRAEIESIDTVKELDGSHMVIIKSPQMIKDEVLEIIRRVQGRKRV